MTKIYAMFNNKGGVGKTTATLMFGQILAKQKLNVLLIDLDPQSNLTSQLTAEDEVTNNTVYDLIMGFKNFEECLNTYDGGEFTMDYIPSNPLLNKAPTEIMLQSMTKSPGTRLKNILDGKVKETYDLILIDCSPSMDILTTNALAVSDEVIIPVKADGYSVLGINLLMETIRDVQDNYNENLKIGGIFLNEYTRSRVNNKIYEALSQLEQFKKSKITSAVAIKENTIMDGLYINNKMNPKILKQYEQLINELNIDEFIQEAK